MRDEEDGYSNCEDDCPDDAEDAFHESSFCDLLSRIARQTQILIQSN